MTIREAGAALRARKVSCRELAQESLKAAHADTLNAFITVTDELALEQAAQLDHELARGMDRGPLHGIPIAHKDIFDTHGIRTTMGTKIFSDRVPDDDAFVVQKLAKAGCITIGKTNLHELCYGITSTNPHYGAVRNPYDRDRIPGGSSGGSAVAVASGMVLLATGTDTGGSIRIPAAMCGVAGFKPTYGRISRRGVGPLGFTLDHVGPLAKTVEEAALCYTALTGEPVKPIKGLRVGAPKQFFFSRLDPEVARDIPKANYIEVDVPNMEALNAAGRLILLAETAAVWRRHLDRKQDFGMDVLTGIEQGCLVSSADYIDAQRLRRVISQEFEKVWNQVDLLLTPTTPTPAPRIGQMKITLDGVEEDVRLASTRLVRPFNVTGWPALSIPCGHSQSGLPIGMQLVGPAGSDALVLGAGMAWA